MTRLRWVVLYWLALAGTALPRRAIPTGFAYAVARPLAVLSFVLFRRERAALIANLTRVLGDPRAARSAARRSFVNYGRYIVDLFQLPSLGAANVRSRLEFEDWEHLDRLTGDGKGTIFVTLHLGQWEMGAAALTAYGHPMSVIAQALDHAPMNDLVQGLRREMGMRIIRGDRARPEMFRCLARNETLGVLIDVVEPGEGVMVDFFGRPAEMSDAPARIALRTGARIVPAVLARDPGRPARLRPVIKEPIQVSRTGDENEDARSLTQLLARSFEDLIGRFPDQWFAFRPVWPETALADDQARNAPRGHANLLLLKIAERVFAPLPKRVNYALARLAGDIAFNLRPGARADVEDNIRHVLGGSTPETTVSQVAREVFRNVCRYYADLIRLPRVTGPDLFEREIVLRGLDRLKAAQAGGRGAVVATAHFGNAEIAVQVARQLGIDLLVLSEPLNPPELSELVHRLRTANGIPYAEVNFRNIVAALAHLRSGGCLAMTCDRDIQRTGAPLPFFGAETSMPLGAVEMAARTGAALVPAFCRRDGDKYELVFEDELPLVKTGSPKQDALINARAVLVRIEDWIRNDPGQWIVLERIWKPLRRRGKALQVREGTPQAAGR